MTMKETTIQLSSQTNTNEFETYVGSIEGVERAIVDLDTMNAKIEYNSNVTDETHLNSLLKNFK